MDYQRLHNQMRLTPEILARPNLTMGLSLGVLIISAALIFILSLNDTAEKQISIELPHFATTNPTANHVAQQTNNAPIPDTAQWISARIKPGDNLTKILLRYGINHEVVHKIMTLGDTVKPLYQLQPEQVITLKINKNDGLIELRYIYSPKKTLVINQIHGSYRVKTESIDLESHTHYAMGTIKHSLLQDGRAAGLPSNVTMRLSRIFSHKINFAKNLQVGDSFIVIYDDYYLADKKFRNGDILAAEITNRGQTYRAVRFVDAQKNVHYYTPKGNSLERAFLRYPLRYNHISDPFNMHRYHPILHRYRPHTGVDFAAPSGTPVHAAADGTITYHKRKGGYGRTIDVKHSSKYKTRYAHLSRYGAHLHVGSHVKRGQIIGYVGKTGLATGPHLHYEFRIHNKPHNPLTVKIPTRSSIAKKYRAKFSSLAKNMVSQLELYKSAQLASTKHYG